MGKRKREERYLALKLDLLFIIVRRIPLCQPGLTPIADCQHRNPFLVQLSSTARSTLRKHSLSVLNQDK